MIPDRPTRKPRQQFPHARIQPGAAPGTIAPAPGSARTEVRVMAYGPQELVEREIADLAEIGALRERLPVVWVDVRGLGDVDLLRRLGQTLELHELTLEDVVTQDQLAKVEPFGDALYFVVPAPVAGDRFATRQVDVFTRPGLVCTFQEQAGGWLEPVRARIRSGRIRIRRPSAEYLAYAIVDAVVDHYLPVIEAIGDRIEEQEQAALAAPSDETNTAISAVRHDLLLMRRAVAPLRDALGAIVREEVPSISDETRVFFRDCHDHAVQLFHAIELERERARGLVDLTLAAFSNRMNEVMKVLTIIATIFIPLGFIAGVYGMNFARDASPYNMPELGWRLGYPLALGLMAATAIGLLIFFRLKGWIGSRSRRPPRGS